MGQDGVNGDGEDDDDPDWAARFGDFGDSDESGNLDWDNMLNGSFALDDAEEFNFGACDFWSRYGDSNWQEDATTLLGSRFDFKGPRPSPKNRQLRKTMKLESFILNFWLDKTLS